MYSGQFTARHSVVKANCVKDKAATGGVWREISVSVATDRPFGKTICYFPC